MPSWDEMHFRWNLFYHYELQRKASLHSYKRKSFSINHSQAVRCMYFVELRKPFEIRCCWRRQQQTAAAITYHSLLCSTVFVWKNVTVMLIRLSNVQVLGDFSQSSCSVNFCQKETVASRPMNWPMYQMNFPENCNQNMKFNEKAQLNRFWPQVNA